MLLMELQVEQAVSGFCLLDYTPCDYLPPRASPCWAVSSSQVGSLVASLVSDTCRNMLQENQEDEGQLGPLLWPDALTSRCLP